MNSITATTRTGHALATPAESTQTPSKPAAECPRLDRVVDFMRAVGDERRATILRVLARDSFNVAELCRITEMAQNALSHHLKLLLEAGLVRRRREATHHFYRRATGINAGGHRRLFEAALADIDACALPEPVGKRLAAVIDERRQRSRAFFQANADALTTQQAEICASSAYAGTLAALAEQLPPRCETVLEVGPGDGTIAKSLLDRFDQVTVTDHTPSMLKAAHRLATSHPNLIVLDQDVEALPRLRRFDALIAAMVLHHMAQPVQLFQQAERIVRREGVLLIAELGRHDQAWVREACGDLWQGFEPQELVDWAVTHGFAPETEQHLALRNGFRIQIHAFRRVR